jgi:hypothetical protein
MLRYDNDRRLWENIRQSKTELGSPKVYNVYGILGWVSALGMFGYRIWNIYRGLHKLWNNLFAKQDSRR